MPIMKSLRQRAERVCEVEGPRTTRWSTLQKFQNVIVLGVGLIGSAALMAAAEYVRRRTPLALYIAIFLAVSICLDVAIKSRYERWRSGRAGRVQRSGGVDGASEYSGAVEVNDRYFRSGAGD